MTDFSIQNELLHPLFQDSKLYHAATKMIAPISSPENGTEKASFSLTTNQIEDLLSRYSVTELTFKELQNFPLDRLEPNEKAFITFLQNNHYLFQVLSGLDQHPETLSAEDLKIAAQLAGDVHTLSSEDMKYLKDKPLPDTKHPGIKMIMPTELHVPEVVTALKKLSPEPMSFEIFRHLDLEKTDLLQSERALLNFMQSHASQKVLYNLSHPYQGLLTDDVIRIFISLMGNPTILGAAPIVFMKSPSWNEEDYEDVPSDDSLLAEPVENNGRGPNYFKLRQRIELHASQMKALLHKINPFSDSVTLAQLRKYTPQNEQETELLNLLRQSHVFQALAAKDHDPHDLSLEDIQLAFNEHVMVLTDPYITLVILP